MVKLFGIGVCIYYLLLVSPLLGQEKKKDYGKLNGSIESSMGYYLKDSKLGIDQVDDPFAINTYVNLGYGIQKFRFGLQYELYEPPLLGYFPELKGNKLIQGFAEWQHSKVNVRLGNMFEQFGSGLILRAYEDRAMGLNNSLLGANVRINLGAVGVKFFVGEPRKFLSYTDSYVYGADAELNVLDLCEYAGSTYFSLGGSWVLRDDRTDERVRFAPGVVRAYAGRFTLNRDFFSLGGEYVHHSRSLFYDVREGFVDRKGTALLLNLGLDFSGIGFALELRRLENMEFRIDDRADMASVNLNYLPALTKQHKYILATLFPHQVKGIGEIGGQFDLFGELFGKLLDGKPVRYTVNGSMYRDLESKGADYCFTGFGGDLLFAEIGIELSRKWNKKFKSTLAFVHQKKKEFSAYGFGDMMMASQIIIGDLLYKFTSTTSLRGEIQHMWSDSKDDQRWVMGLLELGIAPRWMLFGSNLYNYRSAGQSVHYYSVGGSYVLQGFRASLTYGRNRAGMQCSGGVCRYVPEYSGLNMLLTFTF